MNGDGGALRRVAVLGSTGSVGAQALDLIERLPDRFEVVALAAGSNAERLADQIRRHRPRLAALADPGRLAVAAPAAREAGCELLAGDQGILAVAGHPAADVVLAAIVGSAGLRPTWQALRQGKRVALANKESLVMAGTLMRDALEMHGGSLVPVDSEHSALHQCLRGERIEEVQRLILTASGGPFRATPIEEMAAATPEQALRHPVWDMGRKISIDSATLMNKGLEVIEAHWLFGLPGERIDVVLHPQSSVHSMVEMTDGSVICQIGVPDMRAPIQYALGHPDRFPGPVAPFDFSKARTFEFLPVDRRRFPCLDLAYAALRAGGSAPAVLNAANEVAVQAFLDRRLGFLGIARLVSEVLDRHRAGPVATLDDVISSDRTARREAEEVLSMKVVT